MTFSAVTAPGATSLTTSGTGPEPPANFSLGNPPVFYDITTTAGYTPPVAVCVHWVQGTFGSDAAEASLRFFHFEDEAWTDVTTPSTPGHPNPDTVANQICGSVTTLSPFAPFAQSVPGGPGGPSNKAPIASAGPAQKVTVGAVVTLRGSARDPDRKPSPLTLQWSQTSGPPVTLSSLTIARPKFTPTVVGVYGFTLAVSDGLSSAQASTTVSARYVFRALMPRVRTLTVGSVIPVAFTLTDAKRVVMGTAAADARLVKPPGTVPAVTATVPFSSQQGQYQVNIPTAGLSAGAWRLDIVLDDGTTHSIPIRLR